MGLLPRVTSRNGTLTLTITDLLVVDAYCHTCCMAQCYVLSQPMSTISAASMTAAAATAAALTQAVMPKAATACSACWHHNATVEIVYSPVWARGEGIINQQLAGDVCLFASLLTLFQLSILHVSVCSVLVCTLCAT